MIKNDRFLWWPIALLLLVIIEVISQTYWHRTGNKDIAAIIYLLAGLGIAMLPMLQSNFRAKKSSPKLWWPLYLLGMLSIFALVGWSVPSIFRNVPLDYKMADMLPIIQIMGERWLAGGDVYAIIPEIWDGMQPIYLPAMWMPFVPAIAIGVDLRWASVLLLIIGVVLVFASHSGKSRSTWSLLTFLPILLMFWFIFRVYPGLISLSEEAVVVFFYLLLAFALTKKSPYLLAISLVLCLLSRYVLVFWVPMFFIYLWLYDNRTKVLKLAISMAIVGLGILWISQGFGHLDIFLGLNTDYLGEIKDPNKSWGFQSLIDRGLGVARLLPYSALPELYYFQIIGSFLLPFICLLAFIKFRKQLSPYFFPICSLKLSLVFFYNFLIMPYTYLFYTSTFLSFAILFQVLNSTRKLDS